jgi:hypothetical protein
MAKMDDIPKWYNEVPQSDEAIFSPASETSKDMQMAVEKAKQTGRADIAHQMETKIEAMFKKFMEETGTSSDAELLSMATNVSKSITSTVLIGCKENRKEIKKEGPIYRAYVLMELPVGPANKALLDKINNEKNLYTKFRATQAYDELDKEVKEFEQFKKEQGQ